MSGSRLAWFKAGLLGAAIMTVSSTGVAQDDDLENRPSRERPRIDRSDDGRGHQVSRPERRGAEQRPRIHQKTSEVRDRFDERGPRRGREDHKEAESTHRRDRRDRQGDHRQVGNSNERRSHKRAAQREPREERRGRDMRSSKRDEAGAQQRLRDGRRAPRNRDTHGDMKRDSRDRRPNPSHRLHGDHDRHTVRGPKAKAKANKGRDRQKEPRQRLAQRGREHSQQRPFQRR